LRVTNVISFVHKNNYIRKEVFCKRISAIGVKDCETIVRGNVKIGKVGNRSKGLIFEGLERKSCQTFENIQKRSKTV